MTKTEISTTPRPGRVVAIVTSDGARLGHVIMRGPESFKAVRKTGTDQDMRRISDRFGSIQTAAAWIEASA